MAEALLLVSVILMIHTYLLYPLVLVIWARIVPHKVGRTQGEFTPSVSMVIAAYNEEDVIEEKVRNCLALDYPQEKIEILIGSDGSTDGTNELVERYRDTTVKLIPYPERQGKLKVLNKTIPQCNGEIVVLSDANTMYHPNAIRKLVRHFADPQIGGVCGKLVLVNPNDNVGGRGEGLYWRYENILKALESKIGSVIGANGAIYAIRKDLFEVLPSHKVVMDDFLIPLRIVEQGYRVIYEPEAIATENTCFDLAGEFTRKVRIGAANFNVIPEVVRLLNPARGFTAFALWSHKLIRWAVPFSMLVAFAANFMLVQILTFRLCLLLQVGFYLLALTGYLADRARLRTGWLGLPYYFVSMNLALLLGFVRSVTGTQRIAWQRVAR